MYYCKECDKLYYSQDCPREYKKGINSYYFVGKDILCPIHGKNILKRLVIKGTFETNRDKHIYMQSLVIKKPIPHINLKKLTADQLLKVKEIYNL